jgi:DNA polymerase-3 subunit delta
MPTTLTPDAVRKQIASRTVDSLYLVQGSDEGEKSQLAAAFADLIEPELRAFNAERLYGGDVQPADVVDAARLLPMMADRRVVVVLQAEKLLQPKRESDPADEALAPLEAYLQKPVPSTTLVLVTGDPLNRQRRLARILGKEATQVECGGPAAAGEAARLIAEAARERGLSVDRAAAARLIALSGGDSAKLRADLDRALTYVGQGTVTIDAIESVVTALETSNDDWALVRALERSNAGAALRELRIRLEDGDSAFAVLGQIAWAVRQPPPRGRFPTSRLPRAIDALFRTDLALKSSGGDPQVLLERLVVELCEGSRNLSG